MIKQYLTFFRRVTILIDMSIAAISFGLAYAVRNQFEGLYFFRSYWWIIPFLSVAWGFALYSLGMYQAIRLKKAGEIIWVVVRAGTLVFLTFGCVTYIFKIGYISRSLIATAFLVTAVLIVAEKMILLYFLRRLRSSGFNFRNILIVGTGVRARHFIEMVNRYREFGLKILGIIDEDHQKIGQNIAGYKVIGDISAIPDVLLSTAVDHVIFIVPRSSLSKIEKAILTCETLGVSVSVAVDLFQTQFTKARQDNMLGFPLLTFETTSEKHQQLIVKRILDFVLSGIGLMILSPIFLLVAILVRGTSKGPAIFAQERCSLNGRRFKLFKFRTMVQDAEAKLEELKEHNQMDGPAFKMDNDPRITWVGKYLRKFSLDELPQLYNVFRGDMSLVGPRPPLPKEVEQYDFWQRRRLSMRPGITCLWQVKGRNKIKSFDEWAKLDLQYIDQWSLALDFKILFMTIPVVVGGIGAK